MQNSKHAYLIIAHSNFYILEKLIKLIDDNRNDIYIHIDKKVKNFDFEKFKKIPVYSKIKFIDRISVNWGGYSQVKCELLLLKAATFSGKYNYYHLLSGVDLPLKTQDYIHKFFEENAEKEFIHFGNKKIDSKYYYRFKYYHLLQENIGKFQTKYIKLIMKALNKSLIIIQRFLRVDRLKNQSIEFQMGANWFSITDSLARFIISKEKWIQNTFKYSTCGDEIFLQTIIWNSEFKEKIYYKGFNNYISCMRYIDWSRGNPYVWKNENFEELINSEYLFARKFDYKIDKEIIDRVFEYVSGNVELKGNI